MIKSAAPKKPYLMLLIAFFIRIFVRRTFFVFLKLEFRLLKKRPFVVYSLWSGKRTSPAALTESSWARILLLLLRFLMQPVLELADQGP
jgi:hypothetical protein